MSHDYFSFYNFFKNELLSRLMVKTKQLYVLPALVQCHFTIVSFNLWNSKAKHDIFTLVINFLRDGWQPKHINLGVYEPINTIGQTLAKKLIKLLDNYA